MTRANRKGAGQATDRMLSHLATAGKPDGRGRRRPAEPDPDAMAELAAADLVARSPDGEFELTAAGRARLARFAATKAGGDIDAFRAQHLALARRARADRPSRQNRARSWSTTPRARSPGLPVARAGTADR
jgi:hypothetical protein